MKFRLHETVATHGFVKPGVWGFVVEPRFQGKYVVVQATDQTMHVLVESDLYSLRAPTNYEDVGSFHAKFSLPVAGGERPPVEIDRETAIYRIGFMQEELDEFVMAHNSGDMAGQADALVDLVYVALGTAHMMNLPWERLWSAVQSANMAKERATSTDDSRSKRKNSLDVVKPEGWTPPRIKEILEDHGWVAPRRPVKEEVKGG